MRSTLQIIGVTAAALLLLSPQLRGAEVPSATRSGVDPSALPDNGSSRPMHSDGTSQTPRFELFLGYSALRAIPASAAGNRLVWLNGGSTSLAFNFNRYFGLVADVGGFADTEVKLSGPGVPISHVADSGGEVFTFLGGPRLSYRHFERVTPFAQVLVGAAHASPVKLSGCTGAGCTVLPGETNFALTAGGGLDIGLTRHVAFRLFQAEYLMTRFSNLTNDGSNMQNDLRLSSGLVFRFIKPVAPMLVTYSCSVSPSSGYPGDPLTVSGTATNLNPKHPASYTWRADAGTVSGDSSTAQLNTAGAAPGSYTVYGHVSDGPKPSESADCSAPYTIMAYQPPTVACSAMPRTLRPGDPSTITANGVSPQNRPLTYTYSSASGSVSGTGTTATLSTLGTSSGDITITCNVMDDRGQTGSATTMVSVITPVAAAPMTQNLCSIQFARDSRRPTRVDNEAKACLDDIALTLQRNTDAKLALIGHSNDDPSDAALRRARHTKEYLVTDKGIDANRIVLYTGPSGSTSVDTVLVPAGATLTMDGVTPR